MASNDNDSAGAVASNQFAHFFHLADIRDNRPDADNVVRIVLQFLHETVEGGEIQQDARRVDVSLDDHQPEGAMEHPQGERPLPPCHLVLVQLHGVDFSAAVFIVAGIGAEDAGQQNLRMGSRRVPCIFHHVGRSPRCSGLYRRVHRS